MNAATSHMPPLLLQDAAVSLVLPHKSTFVAEHIDGLRLRRVNLQSPIFDGCTLQQSTFEACDFSNARLFNRNHIEDCRFTRVNFRVCGLGSTVFRACVFEKCDFRGSHFDNCILEACTFINCRIVDTNFPAASIKGCRFEGKLEDVRFITPGITAALDADFSDCILDYVSFQNCCLDAVIPPRDLRHVYLPDVALRARRALEALLAAPETASTKVLTRRLRRYAQMQGDILNLDNLRHVEDPPVAEALIAALSAP